MTPSQQPDLLAQALHLKHSLDFIDKALGRAASIPPRAAAMTSLWHQLDTSIGDGALVEVFYDVDTDDAGKHAVCIHEVQIVGASGCTVDLDAKHDERVRELCLADWLTNHKGAGP